MKQKFQEHSMTMKTFEYQLVSSGSGRVGCRVPLFGSGSGSGVRWSGRVGPGYLKKVSGRVRVQKVVPVQETSSPSPCEIKRNTHTHH